MKLFKKIKSFYDESPIKQRKYFIFLIIGNIFSISGIFIQTYGLFGIIGIIIIIIGFFKFNDSHYHYSHLKFYRKLTRHKIWFKVYIDNNSDIRNYIWTPVDNSFYIKSENINDCYIINPTEIFNQYGSNDINFGWMISVIESHNRNGSEEVFNDYLQMYFSSKYSINFSKKDIHIIKNRNDCIDELLD